MQRLRQLTFASLECDCKKRREIFPGRVFGCDMVRYRGLERNVQRLAPLLGFLNLMIAQPHLS